MLLATHGLGCFVENTAPQPLQFLERQGFCSMKRSIGYGFAPSWWARLRKSGPAGREEGASLIELALMLPVLSMLLVGTIFAGITFYHYVTLVDAVAAGARELATNGAATDSCYLAEQALVNAAVNLNTAQINVTFSGTTVSGTYSAGNPSSLTCTLTQNSPVSLQATYPCSLSIPFVGINLCPVQSGSSYLISSQTTVRIE